MASNSQPAVVAPSDRIGFFDLQRQQTRIHDDVRARMDAVLVHGQFILGPEVSELEAKLAAFSGVPHAIAVSSGRDALMIGLMALGIGPGDADLRRCRGRYAQHGSGRSGARHRRGSGGGQAEAARRHAG
jgi:UDP-2-acetamido-2-deoxy-ribo-hexuluronate aminotransferase